MFVCVCIDVLVCVLVRELMENSGSILVGRCLMVVCARAHGSVCVSLFRYFSDSLRLHSIIDKIFSVHILLCVYVHDRTNCACVHRLAAKNQSNTTATHLQEKENLTMSGEDHHFRG